MRHLITCLLMALAVTLSAQPQHRYWYFGVNAGLDMSTEPPTALTGSPMFSDEGTASIANAAGQLLFYTDGVQVWDRTNAVMPGGTGLEGHSSSSQSALIVPFPDDPMRYYLFTVPAQINLGNGWTGAAYSVVDMTAHEGLGAVTGPSTHLVAEATEKLTATRHANGRDVWVLVHGWNNNAYHAYLITCEGVTGPVTSNVGETMGPDISGTIEATGCMQFNAQGTRLATAWQAMGDGLRSHLNVLRFDNATGVVSDPVTITHNAVSGYGVCFSSSGERLYLSETGEFTRILQYTTSAADLAATEVEVATDVLPGMYGALQRGPDGTIWVARFNFTNTIARIITPELAGTACGVVNEAADLGAGLCKYGLPNYWDTYPPVVPLELDILRDTLLCEGGTVVLDATVDGADSYAWSTGATTPIITVDAVGTYTVEVTLACEVVSDAAEVKAGGVAVDLGPDRLMCADDSLALFAPTGPDLMYFWNTGSTDSSITVHGPGTYSVQVFETDGCTTTDVVQVATTNCACRLFVPNTFTPNGDGFNDTFAPACDCALRHYGLAIYDRWGEEVFRSDDPARGWDGAFRGTDAGPAVMQWRADYEYFTTAGYKHAEAQGHVMVLR